MRGGGEGGPPGPLPWIRHCSGGEYRRRIETPKIGEWAKPDHGWTSKFNNEIGFLQEVLLKTI